LQEPSAADGLLTANGWTSSRISPASKGACAGLERLWHGWRDLADRRRGAIMAAMNEPAFSGLVDTVYAWDRRRTELLLEVAGRSGGAAGMVQLDRFLVARLFRRFVLPHLRQLVDLTIRRGCALPTPSRRACCPWPTCCSNRGSTCSTMWIRAGSRRPGGGEARFGGRLAVAGASTAASPGPRAPAKCRAVRSAVCTLGPEGGSFWRRSMPLSRYALAERRA